MGQDPDSRHRMVTAPLLYLLSYTAGTVAGLEPATSRH